jgi:hypothetical protein
MTATLVPGPGYTQRWIEQVAPVAQASVNADAVLAGSAMDVRGWASLAYTIVVATNTVDWTVYGAHLATFADEVVVQAEASVLATAVGSYAVSQAPFSYYRVKIHSNVGGAHGTATLVGMAK